MYRLIATRINSNSCGCRMLAALQLSHPLLGTNKSFQSASGSVMLSVFTPLDFHLTNQKLDKLTGLEVSSPAEKIPRCGTWFLVCSLLASKRNHPLIISVTHFISLNLTTNSHKTRVCTKLHHQGNGHQSCGCN